MSSKPRKVDPNLILGLDAPDDAGVYRIDDEVALVQTVDFFTPVVDDPYDWGAIAVANAVSDVYAMGGKPLLGLNLVGWPRELDHAMLGRLLEGGADKAEEAGVSIIGGHTIDDQEPKYGMAVTGTVHPDKIVRSSGALPGMSLVLTKPLGTGIASSAIKQQQASPQLIKAATATMVALNRDAAAAMVEARAAAATDVTGFGLMGHLHNMLRLSGVSAEVSASAVPVLDEVVSLAERGIVPGGSRRNEEFFKDFVSFHDSISKVIRTVLFDAQTSGGLLIAIDPGRVGDLVSATVIGQITEAGSATIRVSP
ncbi:MAG: selenide, water dikinase SelD [Actinomycetota bacterium]